MAVMYLKPSKQSTSSWVPTYWSKAFERREEGRNRDELAAQAIAIEEVIVAERGCDLLLAREPRCEGISFDERCSPSSRNAS
jgi:hypothetical protein